MRITVIDYILPIGQLCHSSWYSGAQLLITLELIYIKNGSITKPVGFSQVDMEPLSAWFRQPCH